MTNNSTTGIDSPQTIAIRVQRVAVSGFRGIDQMALELDEATTYLVGENNAGKTSVLLALWTALGARRPMVDDLRRDVDGVVAAEASIDVFVVPREGEVFAEDVRQRLLSVQRDPTSGVETVGFRVTLLPSQEGMFLSLRRAFLQPGADGAWIVAPTPTLQPQLMQLFDAQFLDASRDLVSELGNRTSSWGRVLADLQIGDAVDAGDSRTDLEQALSDVANRVRTASPVLSMLERDLKGLVDAIPSVGRVELQPLPPRLEEIVRTAEVVLHQDGDPALPLRFHGSGSRSLAALLVFQTLANIRLGADQGVRPQLLTLLEEPEAHLHPQSISALRSLLDRLPGQRIVSTHAPQLVAHANPKAVRLLRRTAGAVRVLNLPPETAKRIAQFRRYVERPFGEILFARAVVFGDGSTERCVLPVLLSAHFGCDPGGLGISFIDCESMNHEQTPILVRAAHELGLPWVIFADNDESGERAVAAIAHPDTGAALTFASPEVVVSGHAQIEQILIDAGYTTDIEAVAKDVGTPIGAGLTHLKFLTNNKPWAAELVAIRAVAAGRSLPACIVDLGNRLAALVGRGQTPGTS